SEGSIRAVAVSRAGPAPASPVYQLTVLAGVPATKAVAVAKGGPATRRGGWVASVLKKSLAAAIAEAAGSAVCASWLTALVSAACRFTAVAAGVAPIANWFAPTVGPRVASKGTFSLEPSGSATGSARVAPLWGLPPSKSRVTLGGGPG